MNLNTLFNRANKASYFSRSTDEIWGAIGEGVDHVYQSVIAENRGFFIKWDTTTVTIVPNQLEYTLPADLEQVLRVRERVNPQDQWRIIRHQDLTADAMLRDSQLANNISYDFAESQFSFFGPYEPASVAQDSTDDETYNIRFSPTPVDTRMVELVYVVKYVEPTSVSSQFIIPREGHGAVLDFAIGELMTMNGDSRAESYYEKAEAKLAVFLISVRDRQLQDQRVVTPYIEDLS